MRPEAKIAHRVVQCALAAGAALLLYLTWLSLRWPLIHDAALMHYIAWLIGTGAAPYRDAFDSNMPGVYLIHMALLAVGGSGNVAFRVFDLGWLSATAALMFLYCGPAGTRWSGAAAALLFSLQHVSGGAALAGQRDFLLCLFLVTGAYGVARSSESGGRLAPLAVAGLALGFGTMIKPFAGLFLLTCGGAAATISHRAGRSWVASAATVLGAGIVVPGLMLGWVAAIGGLEPLYQITAEWALPFYGRLGGEGPLWHLVSLRWAFLGAAALLGALRRAPAPHDARRWLAIGGVAYGFLHFALQSKGYSYHLYPLACFVCLLAGLSLAPDARGTHGWASRIREYAGCLPAALAVTLALVVMGERGIAWANEPGNATQGARVDAVVFDLRKLLPQGGGVQVLGPPGGHVLLKMRLRQPTRFFTDFQFFVPTEDRRIQALREEFIAGLDAHPPAAIVIFPGRGTAGPYSRIAEFPGLAAIIGDRYFLAEDGQGYLIYLKNRGQVSGSGEWVRPHLALDAAAAQTHAAAGPFGLTLSPAEITISRAPSGSRAEAPRTHPSASIVATVTPPLSATGGVTLGIVDTSYGQGRGIGWYPGYVYFSLGTIGARSAPPWQETIEFKPPVSTAPLGVHKCKIVVNDPRGDIYMGEATFTVTVVDP